MIKNEYTWKFKDDPQKWQDLEQELIDRWPSVHSHTQQIEVDLHLTNQEKIDHISKSITTLYYKAASHIFGQKTKEVIWKKWISKKAQASSIAYHRHYRDFKKKRHKTHTDWKKHHALKTQ